MSHNTLEQCKHGKDVLKYCKQCGCIVKPGKGSHMKVINPSVLGRPVTVPNEELPAGTKRAIVKQLFLIGITVFLIFIIVGSYIT